MHFWLRSGGVHQSPSRNSEREKSTGYMLLPLAEFAYNNHVHSSTQQMPFLLDTG